MATRRIEAAASAPDGALLRLVVGPGHWAEELPPVPDGHVVTVSFSSLGAATEHGDALALLGYRVVGVHVTGAPVDEEVADFLVSQSLIHAYPRFWRSLADHATRVYSLALGPVVALLGDELRAHLQGTG